MIIAVSTVIVLASTLWVLDSCRDIFTQEKFILSSLRGDLSEVKRYTIAGRDLNESLGEFDFLPITAATTNRHYDVMMFLVSHGARVCKKDRSGKTAVDVGRGDPKSLRIFSRAMDWTECKPR